MGLKSVSVALFVAVLAWAGDAAAADYRPDEYLSLELSRAALSPKRLGPPTRFAPVPVVAKSEIKSEIKADKRAAAGRVVAEADAPRNVARPKPLRRGNPLDAQAMDARVQVWPCRSGGICSWKR